MISATLEKNEWKVQPDTTVQVVDPYGLNKPEAANSDSDSSFNWRSILVSLAIISVVSSIVGLVILVNLKETPLHQKYRTKLLDELGNFPQYPGVEQLIAQWIAGDLAFISNDGGIQLQQNKETSTLVSPFVMKQIRAVDFSVSSDGKSILLKHSLKQTNSLGETAKYNVYSTSTQQSISLKLSSAGFENFRFQHAQWLKGTTYTHHNHSSELLVVSKNNIYYMADPQARPIAITNTGKAFVMFNGVPDLMSSEFLDSRSFVWPNPSGTLIAFVSFDASRMEDVSVLQYDEGNAKPSVLRFKYPTVTGKLSKISVWVCEVDPSTRSVSKWLLNSTISFTSDDRYVISVGWSSDVTVWVSELSRDQTTSHLMTCDQRHNWQCQTIFKNGFSGASAPLLLHPTWLSSTNVFFAWPRRTGETTWIDDLLIEVNEGEQRQIGLGRTRVRRVLSSNPETNLIYFIGYEANATNVERLYAVNSSLGDFNTDGSPNALPLCLSCAIPCESDLRVTLSGDFDYAVVGCWSDYFPEISMIKLNQKQHNKQSDQKEISVIRQAILINSPLAKLVPFTIKEYFSTSGGLNARVTISMPPGWVRHRSGIYPLVIQIVGVEQHFRTPLGHLKDVLASDLLMAHAQIKFWRKTTSYQPREQLRDKAHQISIVIKELLDKHTFLDREKVMLWGSESGASVALLVAALRADGRFNITCAATINPIVNWELYGTFWSDRLFGSSTNSSKKSSSSSNLFPLLGNLGPTEVLLVQSAQDPISNHAFAVAQRFFQSNIHFQHVVYPGMRTSLRSYKVHLINTFIDFIKHNSCVNRLILTEDI